MSSREPDSLAEYIPVADDYNEERQGKSNSEIQYGNCVAINCVGVLDDFWNGKHKTKNPRDWQQFLHLVFICKLLPVEIWCRHHHCSIDAHQCQVVYGSNPEENVQADIYRIEVETNFLVVDADFEYENAVRWDDNNAIEHISYCQGNYEETKCRTEFAILADCNAHGQV